MNKVVRFVHESPIMLVEFSFQGPLQDGQSWMLDSCFSTRCFKSTSNILKGCLLCDIGSSGPGVWRYLVTPSTIDARLVRNRRDAVR